MKRILNVGLIGFGNAGKFYHAPFIEAVEGLNLKKIRETKEENIGIIQNLYPDTIIIDKVDELFQDPEIDIIVIAAPNQFHYNLAKEALIAEKHVVVDKPFTVTSVEAEDLIYLANKKNLVLTVYHNRRFASDFKTVKKIIEGGSLGDIVEYEACFDRFRDEIRQDFWKEKDVPGSGILYDMGSHLIDQALYFFGLPLEVFGDLRIQRKGGAAIDNFELILSYERLKVSLKGSMLVKQPRPQFAVFGEKGCFIKYGMDIQERDARNGKRPNTEEEWGVEPAEMWGSLYHVNNPDSRPEIIKSEKGDYAEFYRGLYRSICDGDELLVKPEEARDVIRIIELSTQSNNEKRIVKWQSFSAPFHAIG